MWLFFFDRICIKISLVWFEINFFGLVHLKSNQIGKTTLNTPTKIYICAYKKKMKIHIYAKKIKI